MKKEIHPKYQPVLFVDSASGYRFVCGSTLQTDARETFEGVEYPVCYLSISSASHPFFTGSRSLVDAEGRVEKFRKRFGSKKEVPQDNAQDQQSKEEAPQQKAAAKKEAPAKKAAAPAAKAPASAKAPAKAEAPAKAAAAPAAKAAKPAKK